MTDNDGGTGDACRTTCTRPPTRLPHGVFTDTEAGLKASFDGTGSNDPDGTIASYAWDFGDGGTGTAATAEPHLQRQR